jgi:periplasmic divalent cation tolerance protein
MRVIFATCSAAEADTLASRLVEERLVGCVNVLPGVRSIYHWQGEVCRDEEIVLLMETTDSLADAASERLRALHSYDVPKVVVIAPERCDEAYAAWLDEVTGPAA